MTDYHPPADLIDLKARWYAADAEVKRISAEAPAGDLEIPIAPRSGTEEPRTVRQISEEQADRLWTARVKLQQITMEIFRHPWKRTQYDPDGGKSVHDAEQELNRLARARYEATLTAPAVPPA